ncbi:hypothetical protein WOLCODRAFT_152585 [Wolfiporia cocos MD-104 SS10]|uniref:Uncharacterized protein n=1 Tax=Wolfiporia cocos (strain MD-104) TaxID=742152 RepID=A0A2H3JUH2_WOLCO|nr:hypothetical protein WOLCODRAFT_152585 [Wolfiporia cocos MD-104 SS10]
MRSLVLLTVALATARNGERLGHILIISCPAPDRCYNSQCSNGVVSNTTTLTHNGTNIIVTSKSCPDLTVARPSTASDVVVKHQAAIGGLCDILCLNISSAAGTSFDFSALLSTLSSIPTPDISSTPPPPSDTRPADTPSSTATRRPTTSITVTSHVYSPKNSTQLLLTGKMSQAELGQDIVESCVYGSSRSEGGICEPFPGYQWVIE